MPEICYWGMLKKILKDSKKYRYSKNNDFKERKTTWSTNCVECII